MKKKQIIKGTIAIIVLLIGITSLVLFGYSLYLYKGIETFYRIYGIIILLYLLVFLGYLIFRFCTKKKIKGFITCIIILLIISTIECTGYYYLTKIYKTINEYSNTENMYYSSLITFNKDYSNYKDLKDKKIGIVNDTSDVEGNILPLEIINELKLKDSNEIKEFNSSIELLIALKDNEIDAAFFSSNYVDMFYSLEGFENIEEEAIVLHEDSKEYVIEEETHNTEGSSFTKPFTILFIGVDSSNDGVTSGYNADVLILVTFNPQTLQATMTSVPRDMYLKTACSNGAYRRINTTTWGSSSSCAVKTIENLFDVKVDYYAKINFKGIVQLVDALGGIDVDVEYSFCDQNSSRAWGNNTVFVDAGKQHLNGEQSLALARNRHVAGDNSRAGKQMDIYCPDRKDGQRNDYTRGKNQLKVIMGIVSAATKLTDVNKAIEILEKININFQTNIKTDDVIGLYNLGKTLLFTDSSNLINVQRMQLKGFNQRIWDINSKSYPSVTIPYNGSIKDIKEQININLGNKEATMIKNASFDLNNPFKDTVLGQGSYSQSGLKTLKDVSSYSISSIKSYANENGLSLRFIDVDTGNSVDLESWGEYGFHSQNEHVDTVINQISTLTINVKKSKIEINNSNNDNDKNDNKTDESTSNEPTPEIKDDNVEDNTENKEEISSNTNNEEVSSTQENNE